MQSHCAIEECRKVFLEIAQYWKSALVGGISLLLLILGLWTWSYAQYADAEKAQNEKIVSFEKFTNEMSYLRSDATQILANQSEIIQNQRDLAKSIDRILRR